MLLEREPELELLANILDELSSTGGKLVLIRGEAGIGKTALLTELAATRSDTVNFMWGWCDDLSTPEPMGPIWDIARNEPDLGRALFGGDRIVIMEEVLDLLSRKLRPTVLILEDTQWADMATLDMIKYLGRRIAQTSGLLIATYRDGEVDREHPLRAVVGQIPPEVMIRIQLERLSRAGVASMVDEGSFDIDQVIDLTAGNPLFVRELLTGGPDQVPESVQDSVLSRLGHLSPGAIALLELVSVVPGRCEQRLIEGALDLSPAELAECLRSGLLKVEAADVFYPHELARRAVESALDPLTRRELNRKVLNALGADASPSRVIHHAVGAADIPVIVEFGPLAARTAFELGSIREALAHFRRLEPFLDEIDVEERAAIVNDWAHVEFYNDDDEDSVGVINHAIELYRSGTDIPGLVRALTFAVRVHEIGCRPEEAMNCAEEALLLLENQPPGPELAAALGQRGWLAMMRFDDDLAVEYARQALELAEELGDEMSAIYSLNTLGVVLANRGEPDGLSLLDSAVSRAQAGGFRFEEVRGLGNLGYVMFEEMDLDASAEYSTRARELAGRYEFRAMEAHYQVVLADIDVTRGREWAAAADKAVEVVDSLPHSGLCALLVLGRIQARTGRPEAWDTLQRAWTHAQLSQEPQYMYWAAATVAEAVWLTGNDPGALLAEVSGIMADVPQRRLIAKAEFGVLVVEARHAQRGARTNFVALRHDHMRRRSNSRPGMGKAGKTLRKGHRARRFRQDRESRRSRDPGGYWCQRCVGQAEKGAS